MPDSNLTVATRTMYDNSWKHQITYGMPVLKLMMERKRMRMGGLWISNINEVADSESLVQEYGPEEGLDAASKDIMGVNRHNIAFMQVPIMKTIDEEIMNAPPGDTQLTNIARRVTASCQRAAKIRLAKRIWGVAGDTEIDDKHTLFQGIPSALYSTTYGNLAKASNTWWYSADYANITTAYTISIKKIREWIADVRYYHEDLSSLVIILSTTLFQSLQAEMDARNVYKPTGNLAKQGFQRMELDGITIAEDPFLNRLVESSVTLKDGTDGCLLGEQAGAYTGAGFCALLNLDTWVFRYVKARGATTKDAAFTLTDYFDLSQLPDGPEKKLARVKFKGNLECHQPNANMLRAAVAA